MKPVKVYRQYYLDVLNNTLKPELRAYLYPDEEFKSDNYYLIFDGLPFAGFTTNKNGILEGLFSSKKGKGKELFKLRLKQAIKDVDKDIDILKLFCIGDKLRKFYESYGFKVTKTIKFDKSLAQPTWNYDKFGTPDLYEMECKIKDIIWK